MRVVVVALVTHPGRERALQDSERFILVQELADRLAFPSGGQRIGQIVLRSGQGGEAGGEDDAYRGDP